MTIDEIKELIHVVNQTGIAELEVTRGDNRVRIKRSTAMAATQEYVLPPAPVVAAAPVAAVPAIPALTAQSQAPPPAPTPTAAASAAPVPDEKTVYVKSPIVGTFYDSPNPNAPAFVKVGDRVSQGQVLCIIESMKLMNEIESEVSGTIISRLVDTGKPVEYGEALFAIQPA